MKLRGLLSLSVVVLLLGAPPVMAQTPGPAAGPTRAGPAPRAARTRAPVRRGRVPRTPALSVTAGEDARPYHLRVHVDVAREGVAEAVADSRWLAFDVLAEGARRPLTCVYPAAPTRIDDAKRVREPAVGTSLFDVVVDLRMFCTGRAFEALRAGARIVPRYGVRSATRTRFVARDFAAGRPLANVAGSPVRFVPVASDAAAAAAADAPVVTLSVAPFDASARSANLVARVSARRETRVYVRPDLFGFAIRTPAGREVRCEPVRRPVNPIVDFFTRVGPGRAVTTRMDLARVCPGVFEQPGIYDLIPWIELPYDGGTAGVLAATGRFRGPLSHVRVRPGRDSDPSEFVRPATP